MNFSKILSDAVTIEGEYFDEEHNCVHVGFGVDANFVRPMGITITSLAINNQHISFVFHVFLSSIDEIDKSRLMELEKQFNNIKIINYHVSENLIKMLPVKTNYTLATYFRLMMPLVLSKLERLLYLDADIICLGQLDDLFTTDLGETLAAVVPDIPNTSMKRVREFKLKYGVYFNAGVMLINISAWNKANISANAVDLLLKNPERYKLLDQDVLNILLDGKITRLPAQYNYIVLRKSEQDVPTDTTLMHCAAVPKPWKVACRNITQFYFLHYKNLSPWSETLLIPPTDYHEAKAFSQKLFSQKRIAESCYWFGKYIIMKATK